MAPYLHNGSVPTLYDLMLPPASRPVRFAIGQRDYDPRQVGFRIDIPPAKAKYVVDTTKPGNSNAGHDYNNAGLSEEDRQALVEYMKSL